MSEETRQFVLTLSVELYCLLPPCFISCLLISLFLLKYLSPYLSHLLLLIYESN